MSHSLEDDLRASKEILELVKDDSFATELYAAMCNIRWFKEEQEWTSSWRYSGGIVASLRKNEETNGALEEFNMDYCEFYCSGGEGSVTPRVEAELKKLGWSWRPYED